MKFIKLMVFDMKEGILKNKLLFLSPLIISFILFLNFHNKVIQYSNREIGIINHISFSDFFVYTYGGMKEYIPQQGNPFLFPMVWLMVFLTIPVLLVNYPYKDLQHVGQQVLVRARGRGFWWMSKCVWNVMATLMYHGILIGVSALLCKMNHLPFSREVNLEFQGIVASGVVKNGFVKCTTLPFAAFLLPIIVSVILNLFQMCISLFVRPVYGFLITMIVFVSSAYLLVPYMIGNYAMLLRLDCFYESGVSLQYGYGIMLVLAVISIVVGKIRFHRYDILNRE